MTHVAETGFEIHPKEGESPVSVIERGGRAVIIFPGTLVNAEMPVMAQVMSINGMIGKVRDSLHRSKKDEAIDIYCTRYSARDETAYIREHVSADRLVGTEFEPLGADAHQFVTTTLLPIMGIIDGKKPDLKTAHERLSRLTLVGHSVGTVFAKEVGRTFRQELLKHGYSNEDITLLCREVSSIALANSARIKSGDGFNDMPGFRTFAFQSDVDQTVHSSMQRINDWLGSKHHIPGIQTRVSYNNAGYSLEALDAREQKPADYEHIPSHRSPLRMEPMPDGMVIRAESPGKLTWQHKGKNRECSVATLNQEYHDGIAAFAAHNIPNLALDGKQLIPSPLTPAHHVHMFLTPTDAGNRPLVRKVDEVLAKVISRAPTQPRNFRQENLAMVMNMQRAPNR